MTHDVVRRSSRRRRRVLPAIALLSLLIFVIGWSSLWLIARHGTLDAMDEWFNAEAARGRLWTCPDRDISGFPLRIALTCKQPTFQGKLDGNEIDGTLAGFVAETPVYQPNGVEATLTGPLTLRRPDAPADTVISWSDLKIGLRFMLAARIQAALSIRDLDVAPPDGPANHADSVELRLAPLNGQPGGPQSYETLLQVGTASVPLLDARTGNADPLTFEQKATLTGINIHAFEPWPALAERWRAGGGTFDLVALTAVKGGLRLAAQGQLRFDDQHRPMGRLQTTVSGYEPLAEKLGLPLQAVSVGGALANLLGGPKAPAPVPGGLPGPGPDHTVSLPVVLGDGRVAIGPFKTPLRLEPLF